MTLAAPNLDDRRFQDLVDEAKRLVQQRCPEWTDHNVSDPGVTLIETFATMVDQLLYRLNRVPDRLYVKFLQLLGVPLFPATAARTDVTFWLSAPQPDSVHIASGTRVATVRTEAEDAVTFSVVGGLVIAPCSLVAVASSTRRRKLLDLTDRYDIGEAFQCFGEVPAAGDTMLLGLSQPVASCAVLLRFTCPVQGLGVDPDTPPLAWDAWDGSRWSPCEVERDETGGLNLSGDVVLHLPPAHAASVIGGRRACWIRCRVTDPAEGQPTYRASPTIETVSASTVGGTAPAEHCEVIEREVLGVSEGVPAQRLPLRHRPLVAPDEPPVLEVSGRDGWEEWLCVQSFAASGPDDRHFEMDEAAGEIRLGPAVRDADGTLRRYGAVPEAGATLRLRSYRTGGGRRGNVAARAIAVLTSSVPFVGRVENRRAASGGVDAETVDAAKVRIPVALRTLERAVTVDDYEHLAHQAAPEVARVRCLTGSDGCVRVLVVPSADEEQPGRLRFDQLVPDLDLVQRIARFLDDRRVVGARVVVEPPRYQGMSVVARLHARPRTTLAAVEAAAREALHRYFHPLTGGPNGDGWPFGRPVHVGEVYSVLQRVSGVEYLEDVRLFPTDAATGDRQGEVQRIEIGHDELVWSVEHRVRAERE